MAAANKTAFCLRLTQSQIKNRSSCADRSAMKPIFSILFSFLLFLIAPALATANEVCPNEEQEWTAIKYRAFHMKLFQVAGRCFPHSYENGQRTHSTAEGPRVDRASMKLSGDCAFRPFHVDQMRIASEYFDRRYPGAGRADTYSTSGECRRSTPLVRGNRNTRYNLQWESYETNILNKLSMQISNTQATPAAWQSYCAQAIATIDQVLEAESSDDIVELINEHPFAQEHDLPQCDNGNGAVSTAAVSADGSSADADTASDRDVPIATNPERQNQISSPETAEEAEEDDVILLNRGRGEDVTGAQSGPTVLLPPISLADYAREQGTTVVDSVMLQRLVMPGQNGLCLPHQRTIMLNGTSNVRCLNPQQNP